MYYELPDVDVWNIWIKLRELVNLSGKAERDWSERSSDFPVRRYIGLQFMAQGSVCLF